MLDEIIKNKHREIAQLKSSLDISRIDLSSIKKPFYKTLLARQNSKKNSIIAEIKKKSPSKGILSNDLDVSKKAKEYEEGGASCLSVLTEKDYFNGAVDDLLVAKRSVSLPVLRKDFIIDPLQVYESKMIGADCILLIASALSDQLFEELYSLATSLDLDVLAEVHDKQELEFVRSLDIKLLGINNRNLQTFNVDINTSIHLSDQVTDNDTVLISESGIHTSSDISKLNQAGIYTFLIGEHLVKSNHVSKDIGELINVR